MNTPILRSYPLALALRENVIKPSLLMPSPNETTTLSRSPLIYQKPLSKKPKPLSLEKTKTKISQICLSPQLDRP